MAENYIELCESLQDDVIKTYDCHFLNRMCELRGIYFICEDGLPSKISYE